MNLVLRPAPAETEPVRRAGMADVERLAKLFAAAFRSDPVFDWLVPSATTRQRALERFFHFTLKRRIIPHGETWISANRLGAAAWIPPYSPAARPSLADDLRMLPLILRLTGIARIARGAALAAAMEKAEPKEPYFYLAFIAVAPRLQGKGFGTLLLERSLARIDAVGANAYVDSSQARNLRLYERAGFSIVREIKARKDAPPLFAMWRPARPRSP